MNLSTHFSLAELLTPSDPGQPDQSALENMKRLCEQALEPLRERLGRPLIVTSGFRSSAYNRLIKGAPGSQHCLGIAADIAMANDAEQLKAAAIASQIKGIGGIGIYPGRGFIHVDIRHRIAKAPASWAQIAGKYQRIPMELRKAIQAHGGKL